MVIIRSSVFNVIGSLIPALAAIPVLGFLARSVDIELFGIFLIFYSILGYSSVLELGVSKSLIREVAKFQGDEESTSTIISTSGVTLLFLGCVSGGVLYLMAPCFSKYINVSDAYYEQVLTSLSILSLVIPFMFTSQLFMAFWEGSGYFVTLSLAKIITGIISVIAVAIVSYIGPTLVWLAISMLIARVLNFTILIMLGYRDFRFFSFDFSFKVLKKILSFGGWLSISGVVAPLMVYLDRLIVANIHGASISALYSSPSELVNRLSLFPESIARVIFVILSRSYEKEYYNKGYALVIMVVLPLGMFVTIFADGIINLWLGEGIDSSLIIVLQILIIGFIFNSISRISVSKILSKGMSKKIALIHILEVFPYLLLFYFLTFELGVIGSAISWSLRCIIDCALLYRLSRKIDYE